MEAAGAAGPGPGAAVPLPGPVPVDDRAALEGILWVPRNDVPWRELPTTLFGVSGVTCWRRLRDWAQAGVWQQLHEQLLAECNAAGLLDLHRALVDSSHIRGTAERVRVREIDPDEGQKLLRIVRRSLGQDEYVLSADEKPGVQARMRLHLPLPPGPGRAMRAESEYHRYGTLAYLAAYDVHHARVMGRCEPSTGIKPFTALVDQVMSAEPYASARRVFWVVDNGASPRNWAAADRLSNSYPNAQMVHLPVHASWLNQVVRHESRMRTVELVEGGSADVDGVVLGPVRKDRPRFGVRRG